MTPTLQHAGIQIRPLNGNDRESLYTAVCESAAVLSPWMPWCRNTYTVADAEAWIALCQTDWQSGTDREFGIIDLASGEVLGCVGINQIDRANRFGNLGYWVRAGCTGQGVATLAARLAAQFAFREQELARLEIVAITTNLASRRVAEKLGCHFEGIARKRLFDFGRPYDAAVYSLLPDEIAD